MGVRKDAGDTCEAEMHVLFPEYFLHTCYVLVPILSAGKTTVSKTLTGFIKDIKGNRMRISQ